MHTDQNEDFFKSHIRQIWNFPLSTHLSFLYLYKYNSLGFIKIRKKRKIVFQILQRTKYFSK